MESVQIQNKIKLLFEKIVEPNYVMDNYYADDLINKLSDCSDPDIKSLASVPLLSDLIIEALDHSEHVHKTVKVFLIRMLAIVSNKELHFAKIFSKKGDMIKSDFKDIKSQKINPSLLVAYMELAIALASHNSGVAWIIESGVWKEILSLCNEKRTVFIVRQTYKFASKFFWKVNDLDDEANIKLMLNFILKPIQEIDFLKLESLSEEVDEEIAKTVEPMLHILMSIVTAKGRIEKSTMLLNILLNNFKIITHLYIVAGRIHKEELILLIMKLIFWLAIAKIFIVKPMSPGLTYNADDFMDLGVVYFNGLQFLIQRRSAMIVLDFCNACNVIWSTVWQDRKPAMWEQDGRKIELQNQLILLCLVPPLVYVKTFRNNMYCMTDERVSEFIFKLSNTTCEHTARAAYALRDLTMELDTQWVTLQCVKRLTCLKGHLNNEQANLMFQALFFILKEYDPTDETGELKEEELYEDTHEKVVVMTYVLDTVLILVKNYNINWHESLEVICLYNVVFSILKRPNLICKFVVTALNVIGLTVKKFLPPNLSLLLESKPGSAMHELGKLIYMKMHDINWEIRDSALELLLVCTEISYIKFPPFQKQIIENSLINVAATIALNDHEFYVQTSALKCIGAASKITRIWEHLIFQYPDIQELLISILRNNQEGIVRKEACNVLCDLYQNLKLSPAFQQTLHEHMVSTALSDFHWEVQLSALKFWKIVIQNSLTGQGMLDGTFPPVTFSRETRKIVTLTDTEVQKRLLKVLDVLSSVGCLTLLIRLLHEESEVDVMESALSISLDLIDILNKYKVPEILKPTANEPMSVCELMCDIKLEKDFIKVENMSEPQETVTSDNVIESILNADDVNLLANIYERQMNLQNEGSTVKTMPKMRLVKYASPFLFVDYLNSRDFKDVIEQKRIWKDGIRSFPSLLDDVLGIYEVNNEVNSLDCY